MSNLIFVDLETSGIDRNKCGILSIGAITYDGRSFYDECRLNDSDIIEPQALVINGFTEEEARDPKKVTQKSLIYGFLAWCYSITDKPVFCGENFGQFDLLFLCKAVANNINLDWQGPRRCVDLHSVMYFITGKSMGLKSSCKYFNIEPEPEVHNALNGAKKAREVYLALENNLARKREVVGLEENVQVVEPGVTLCPDGKRALAIAERPSGEKISDGWNSIF